MDDRQIIALFLSRDERAVEETAKKYGRRLQTLAGKLLWDPRDAEECCMDTLMKAWNSIPPHIPKELSAYLFRVCRSLACDKIDWLQAKRRKAELVSLTEELENCLPSVETPQPGGDITEMIEEFLRGLPQQARVLFVRRYWYAESVKEAAKHCGIREGNARVILHRTRESLRSYLEKEGITT